MISNIDLCRYKNRDCRERIREKNQEIRPGRYNSDNEETETCDIECESPKKNDRRAIEVARNSLDGISPAVVKSLVREERNRCLRTLKEKGLSLRQIERLTGVSRTVIRRV